MDFDDREFKRKFPHLYEELEDSTSGESENSESSEVQDSEPDVSDIYTVDAISYIGRARTNEEAIEVVNYLRKKGELSENDSGSIIKQIKERGIRSFGSLKTWGHYERELRKKTVVEAKDEEDAENESD
jgi:hypothetical protein